MTDTIREFEISPDVDYAQGRIDWTAKRSIDLTWVASAQPVAMSAKIPGEPEWFTVISLAGGSERFTIRIEYPKFMKMWMEARSGAQSAPDFSADEIFQMRERAMNEARGDALSRSGEPQMTEPIRTPRQILDAIKDLRRMRWQRRAGQEPQADLLRMRRRWGSAE